MQLQPLVFRSARRCPGHPIPHCRRGVHRHWPPMPEPFDEHV